jgi:hypothetical protein
MGKWDNAEITTKIWDENEQPIIEGVFFGVQKDIGENKSNLYSLSQEDGNILNFWGSTLLDERLITAVAGKHEIRIEFLGKIKSQKGGREYKDYKVFIIPIQK